MSMFWFLFSPPNYSVNSKLLAGTRRGGAKHNAQNNGLTANRHSCKIPSQNTRNFFGSASKFNPLGVLGAKIVMNNICCFSFKSFLKPGVSNISNILTKSCFSRYATAYLPGGPILAGRGRFRNQHMPTITPGWDIQVLTNQKGKE